MLRPYRGMLRGLIHSQEERAENSDTISSSYHVVLLKGLSTDLPALKMVMLVPFSAKKFGKSLINLLPNQQLLHNLPELSKKKVLFNLC